MQIEENKCTGTGWGQLGLEECRVKSVSHDFLKLQSHILIQLSGMLERIACKGIEVRLGQEIEL